MDLKTLACRATLCCVAAGALITPAPPAQSQAADKLPDIIVLERGLESYYIQRPRGGKKLLRFATEIANIGDGPLEIRGKRTSRRNPMAASQHIHQTSGAPRVLPMGTFTYHGVHGHWHLLQVAEYRLLNQAGGTVVEGRKISFCLMDSKKGPISVPNTPNRRVYPYCTESRNALRLLSGISVGWEDNYYASLPDQYIDVTGVPAGNYVLQVEVNSVGTIQEKNTSNNVTSVNVTLP